MSMYSDYAHGCITDEEYKSACAEFNREEKWYEEHEEDEDDDEERIEP